MDFRFFITIDRHASEVYDFFWRLDERDFSDNPVVPVYERMDEGPRMVGSRIWEVIQAPFFRMKIISEITGFVPGERIEYKFTGGGMEGDLLYIFQNVGDKTELTQSVSLAFRGLRKILTPLLPLTYGKVAYNRLQILKKVIESEA